MRLTVLKFLKVVKINFLASVQVLLEYRKSFLLATASICMWNVASWIWIKVLYQFSDSIAGYSIWQYVGFMGIYFFWINFFYFLFENSVRKLSDSIHDGKIDMLLVKPVDSQFSASIGIFDLPSLSSSLFGLAVTIFSLIRMGSGVGAAHLIVYFYIFTLSIIAFYSILFILMTATFYTGRFGGLSVLVSTLFDDPATIPTSAYSGVVKFFFYFIIPVALAVYMPSQLLYFKLDLNLLIFYSFYTLLLFFTSRVFWKIGLRSYSSAGG